MQTMSYDEIIRREAAQVGFGPFMRQKLINVAPEDVRRQLDLAKQFPHLVMARQGFADATDNQQASSTAVASTASETNLFDISTNPPIAANSLKAGQLWKLSCGGVISTTGTPTVQFTARIGASATPASNTSLGASTAVATGSGLANAPWYAEFTLGIRVPSESASGCSGTGNGFVVIGNAAAAAGQIFPIGGTVASAINNTIALGIVISLTWGTNSASNTATCQWRTLQALN